jgi:hypothetical protein
MYKLTLTTNLHAENNYFNKWLRDNYSPDFKGTSQGDNIYIYFESEPDEEVKTAITDFYNAITEADCLHVYQTFKMNEIRIKTNELIAQGYVFAGKTFALSRNVDGVFSTDPQTNILALHTSKNDLPYPIIFNTIDGFDHFVCPDGPTIEAMYLTALATKKAYEDSATLLVQSVTAATTRAQVENIIDPR